MQPIASPTSGSEWQLWRYSEIKGQDMLVDAGDEVPMRVNMGQLQAQGLQVWLTSPDGVRHHHSAAEAADRT